MLKHTRRWLVLASLASAMVAHAQTLAHIAPGPYKAGYLQVIDARPAPPTGAPRTVILSIFYPVEAAQVSETTPRPIYRFAPGIDGRWLPSEAFDIYEYEPSFEGLPVAAGGPFPMVLYSHGHGGPWLMGIHLLPKLATYGYVVVAVTHEPPIIHEAVSLKRRHGDLSFAIDRMLARTATSGDLFAGAIDASRVGAVGYSFGGYSVVALAAGDADPCEYLSPNPPAWACTPAEPDPRVRALVLLDPSHWVFNFRDMYNLDVPVVSIHQSYDSLVAQGDWGGGFAVQHLAFSGSPNDRVDLERTNHHRFASACEALWLLWKNGWITEAVRDLQRRNRRCDDPALLPTWQVAHPIIAEYAIAFLETELAGRMGLQPILTPGHALTSETWVQFFQTERANARAAGAGPALWFFRYQSGTDVEQADPDRAGPIPAESMAGLEE